MVVIREEIKEGTKGKKQPKLFELKGYSYQVIVTNIEEWSPQEVWRFYNQRACLINWFKEGVLGQKKVEKMAKWVRERFFYIPGKLIRRGRKWMLNLPLYWPWQVEYQEAERRLKALMFT